MFGYPRVDVLSMLIVAGALAGLEFLGVFDKHFVTITALLRDAVPMWLRLPILAWLIYHFCMAPKNFPLR